MNDIHPVEPVITLSLFTEAQILFFWAVGGLLFGGLLFLVFRWLRHKKTVRVPSTETAVPSEALETFFLRQLRQLQSAIEAANYEFFYLEITSLIKSYMAQKYHIEITPLTTKETLLAETALWDDDTKNFLKVFLTQVDEAKFAKKFQEKETARKTYDLVYKFLQS
jgi:hypothetical protein